MRESDRSQIIFVCFAWWLVYSEMRNIEFNLKMKMSPNHRRKRCVAKLANCNVQNGLDKVTVTDIIMIQIEN